MVMLLLLVGCDEDRGIDKKGSMQLSMQSYLADTWYRFGYHYEDGDMYRYPFAGDPVPDILNEGFRVIGPDGETSEPGFNTPAQVNGFALVGEFSSAAEALSFFEAYAEVEGGLTYSPISDTVRLHQVWVQKTQAGKYAKLLVTRIEYFTQDGGAQGNEISLDYVYQPDGSASFPE